MSPTSKPKVKLTNTDGNAFMIIGACRRAARSAGWGDKRIAEVTEKMTAGDYDHLLRVAMEHFDVR